MNELMNRNEGGKQGQERSEMQGVLLKETAHLGTEAEKKPQGRRDQWNSQYPGNRCKAFSSTRNPGGTTSQGD